MALLGSAVEAFENAKYDVFLVRNAAILAAQFVPSQLDQAIVVVVP